MRKKPILIALAIVTITFACKAKKTASSTTSADSSMDEQLTAVKARFPDATNEELQKGKSIFTGTCTKCHGTKDITVYTEPKLLEIVDVMAAKSALNPQEKQALIRFAVGVRATSK